MLRITGLRVALAAWVGLVAGQGAAAPERVVSLNLCTDQMAMMLAGPGQLKAVSRLARDPRSSAMVEEARNYPVTSGAAEEVFLLRPDLVLAGTFTTRATVEMLERLGIRVERFAPETSFADIRANLRSMGRLLGREAAAEALVADFDARLAALRAGADGPPPVAVLYQPNGYAPGAGTLADAILDAAGFDNLATRVTPTARGTVPLERLVLAAPDLVIRGARRATPSRAGEVMDHPALRHLNAPETARTGPDWVCGTPHVLKAVGAIAAHRLDMTEAQ